MALKKKIPNKKNKITLQDFVKGNFLNRQEFRDNYKLFSLIFVLLLLIIFSNHQVNQKIELVNKLKEQTEEYKSRNAFAQSHLIRIRMESELSSEMEKDSLLSLESHPLKIVVKLDSIHGTKNK